jgi:hypothetical protein
MKEADQTDLVERYLELKKAAPNGMLCASKFLGGNNVHGVVPNTFRRWVRFYLEHKSVKGAQRQFAAATWFHNIMRTSLRIGKMFTLNVMTN